VTRPIPARAPASSCGSSDPGRGPGRDLLAAAAGPAWRASAATGITDDGVPVTWAGPSLSPFGTSACGLRLSLPLRAPGRRAALHSRRAPGPGHQPEWTWLASKSVRLVCSDAARWHRDWHRDPDSAQPVSVRVAGGSCGEYTAFGRIGGCHGPLSAGTAKFLAPSGGGGGGGGGPHWP
jgi:hypothetical protein